MKINGMRRALVLAHAFNFLVASYFIIISIVSLIKLRWYHQLTISIKVRHFVTSATSYFAFLILIFASIILMIIFVLNIINSSSKTYISPEQDAINLQPVQTTFEPSVDANQQSIKHTTASQSNPASATRVQQHHYHHQQQQVSARPLVITDSTRSRSLSNPNVCCSILLHLIASISLIIILVVWLLNTGELVRDSLSTQLDSAFSKYQFANKSNHWSVAIDGIQDINNCCGSLDYTDFPHGRGNSLSSGHYPGSCCGKNIYGSNARGVVCLPEEIVKARQTSGCVSVLSNYYDLISLLVVPVALISLFVNITMIAMITVSRGYDLMANNQHHELDNQHRFHRLTIRRPASASELIGTRKIQTKPVVQA